MVSGNAPQSAIPETGRPGIICKACRKPIKLLKPVVRLGDSFESSCPHCGDIANYTQTEIILLDELAK